MPVRSVCMQTGLMYGFSLLAGPDLVLTSFVAWVTENTHWPAALTASVCTCHNNIVRGRIDSTVPPSVLCGQRTKKLHNVHGVCLCVCVCVYGGGVKITLFIVQL